MRDFEHYAPPCGLSVPLLTILDREGRVSETDQRALVRYTLQNSRGADILFAAGTTGEWDKLDNRSRQRVSEITVDECRRMRTPGKAAEAWVGITAHTRSETLENLAHAISIGADAAVVAPLSIHDLESVLEFMIREIGGFFDRTGRHIPIFLYDNADIVAPGHAPHLHTRDVKRMSRLDYVRGIKVTASKQVLGNYTRAASHYNRTGEFAIYVGNAYLIFDLFAPANGLRGRLREYWNRYLTRRAVPAGVVAGPANVMPCEWQRGWRACRAGDESLMRNYGAILSELRSSCEFSRANGPYRPTIACLKACLAELGVVSSDAVAEGTPRLTAEERIELTQRFARLSQKAAAILEPQWRSSVDSHLRDEPMAQHA
jgi:dihydrodipicolinate synthase/N-acetylneuraminate lyase